MLKSIHFHLPNTFLSPPPSPHSLSKPTSLTSLKKPTSLHSTQFRNTRISAVLTDDGPIELSSDVPSIFATNDDPTPLQVTTSVLLTGAISVFLFRAVRRRAKRAKELRVRSTGVKTLKEEALDSLKAMGTISIEPTKKDPSPVQAILGGIAAGVIALILYKFTTTIEAALNRQTLSDTFSVRQITVTIRTIINGMCYLATFVFGLNSIGLFLYSGQLTLNSLFKDSADGNANTTDREEAATPDLSSQSPNNKDSNDTDQTS
ncbi:uncharacterized protein LOC141656370 [Silene latifolia]|uniref:uncharacterized protein LOC141656370 n=1 Tax=Silene latifolia TaxID=37657 RepID=UPI003D782CF6